MANKIQLRRGLKSSMPTGSSGEPLFATDTRELYIGTGSGNVNMGGSHWYRGTAMSGTSTTTNTYSYSACPQVKLDDIYLNTSNGNIYACTAAGSGSSAKWTYQGCIKGATGATGSHAAVDSALSPTSSNPVQNKTIYNFLYKIIEASFETVQLTGYVSNLAAARVSVESTVTEGKSYLLKGISGGTYDTLMDVDGLKWYLNDGIDVSETAIVRVDSNPTDDGATGSITIIAKL